MTPRPEPPDILLLTASTEEGLGEEDENDYETPIVDGFENVFTENVFNEFMWGQGELQHSVVTEAERFLLTKTRSHDFTSDPTPRVLLRHYGIKEVATQGSIGSRLRNMLALLFAATRGENHLKNIQRLAAVYCEENPGGLGYSFGGLLERYMSLYLVHFQHPQHKAVPIGGDNKKYIEGGDHETHGGVSAGRADDATVTLHWVRGGYLAPDGDGRVCERVARDLAGFLGHALDPNFLYLCHGTTIDSASAILQQGPLLDVAASHSDFGPAFYLTDSFEFAVFSACQLSKGKTDGAVLVFPVPRVALSALRVLELSGENWKKIVRCCRMKSHKGDLEQAFGTAACVVGSICDNATKTETGKVQPHASEFRQWAFKQQHVINPFFQNIIAGGEVHVFRVMQGRRWPPQWPSWWSRW